ncbi:MAG: 2-oxoacid:ferredoxin oxidoreductase subunit beta [Acetobacteraceae bacterium]|nr:2-oxoacid:ferredoxin oxidoreductase subunit beta [Acetobacteraceae bacterium]
MKARDYLIEEAMPLFWCRGCGNGIILHALLRALARLGKSREETVVVTGIGCFGKADDYIRTHSIHGTHGRALAIATGVKAVNPGLTVLALMGDGDCATIGGNHLIHAARRNIGVTAVVANNLNYGMTGGQFSATTPQGARSSTSSFGNPESGFDLCRLAGAAGAALVARATVYHAALLESLLVEAISCPGFSLVEVMSSCPVYYGRYNGIPDPAAMMRWWQESAVPASRYAELAPEEKQGRFPIGRLGGSDRPAFSERYARVQEAAQAGAGRWIQAGTDR